MVEIGRERCRTHQCCQLAGWHAAHQVHLEETFLRVYVTERVAEVGTVLALQRDRTQRVAADAHTGAQAGQLLLPIEAGATTAEQPPAGGEYDQQQRQECQQQAAPHAPAWGRHCATNTAKMPAYGLTMKGGDPA